MNLIYNKETLRVVSLFDHASTKDVDDQMIKEMFPTDFQKLSLWQINSQINYNPVHLKVKLDKNKNPDELTFKNKVIYKGNKEDKKLNDKKELKRRKKELEKTIPKDLLRSIRPDTIKLWTKSLYTEPKIAKSLSNYQYFYDEKILPVSWWGPFTDAGGYANMNREIIFRLHNYHVIAKAEICPTAPQISSHANYYLSKYTALNFGRLKKHPRVWSFTPIPHPRHNGRNIFFTMMETESLHPEFARICNVNSDEVWVPSSHNQKVFKEYGVKKPVKVMPLGIDETLYKKEDDSEIGVVNDNNRFVDLLGSSASNGIKSFRFLSLFGWSFRKGIDILIKSFVREFSSKDDVALIIVARHAGSPAADHIDVIKSDTMRFANEVRNSDFPQIVLYPYIIPEDQMPSIYRMGHAFISLSRGEGFCLPPIEASACHLPVISCNNTGMSEYLTDDNAYLVKTDEKEICHPEMHWITTYYHDQLFAKLGNDQIEQAQNHMRFVLENYDKALEKGEILRESVFSKYTWNQTAKRVAKRIKDIYAEK